MQQAEAETASGLQDLGSRNDFVTNRMYSGHGPWPGLIARYLI